MEAKNYIIRNTNGLEIESYDSLAQALDRIEEFENMDIHEESYTPNFYEIYDSTKESIVWP